MSIRHLATSLSGTVIAAGEFEDTVHIWDIAKSTNLGTLAAIHSFGGKRLAITNDGSQCVTGSWSKGIASYNTISLKTQWHRKDLKHLQYVRISADDKRVICCLDRKPCHELDRATGETIATFRGVRKLWESPYEPLRLVETSKKKRTLETSTGEKVHEIPKETFAILSVAFSHGFMCISESGGSVRCFDTQSGREAWRFTPEQGEHFLKLSFVEQTKTFVGICWPYDSRVSKWHSGTKRLCHFGSTPDNPSVVADLGHCGETEFCLRGSQLMLAVGALIDSMTGTTIKRLWPTI